MIVFVYCRHCLSYYIYIMLLGFKSWYWVREIFFAFDSESESESESEEKNFVERNHNVWCEMKWKSVQK